MSAAALQAALHRLAQLGATPVCPEILQPLDLYLEAAGEELRGRAFFVGDHRGEELILRPDMTAAAVRATLQEAARDVFPWERAFWVRYDGPVFRRPLDGEPREIRQIGGERFSPTEADPTEDAEIIAAAIEAARAAGLTPGLRLGDVALFAAAVDALELPGPWPERLRRSFAATGGPAAALTQAERPAEPAGPLEEALAQLPPAHAADLITRLWADQGLSPMGGRSAHDIAARLREKASARREERPTPDQIARLRAALAVSGPPASALDDFARALGPTGAAKDAIARAQARLTALERRVGPIAVTFDVGFGRGLAYYDGMAFEVEAAGVRLGGGGRYDRLLAQIAQREGADGARAKGWGAGGFALRPDRLAAAIEAGMGAGMGAGR